MRCKNPLGFGSCAAVKLFQGSNTPPTKPPAMSLASQRRSQQWRSFHKRNRYTWVKGGPDFQQTKKTRKKEELSFQLGSSFFLSNWVLLSYIHADFFFPLYSIRILMGLYVCFHFFFVIWLGNYARFWNHTDSLVHVSPCLLKWDTSFYRTILSSHGKKIRAAHVGKGPLC